MSNIKHNAKGIKEICGFEDSKGRFHPTKEEAFKANQATILSDFGYEIFNKLFPINDLTSERYDHPRWASVHYLSPTEITKVVKYITENFDDFAKFWADYKDQNLSVCFESPAKGPTLSGSMTTFLTSENREKLDTPIKPFKKKWYKF